MKIWIPALLIILGLGGLITMGIIKGGIPEMPVRDLLANAEEYQEGKIKISGVLKKIHQNTRPLKFDVCDREDKSLVVQVEVDDVRPDVFEEGKDIAVIGIFQSSDRSMVGTKIFTKCPSKYEASENLRSEEPTEKPAADTDS